MQLKLAQGQLNFGSIRHMHWGGCGFLYSVYLCCFRISASSTARHGSTMEAVAAVVLAAVIFCLFPVFFRYFSFFPAFFCYFPVFFRYFSLFSVIFRYFSLFSFLGAFPLCFFSLFLVIFCFFSFFFCFIFVILLLFFLWRFNVSARLTTSLSAAD